MGQTKKMQQTAQLPKHASTSTKILKDARKCASVTQPWKEDCGSPSSWFPPLLIFVDILLWLVMSEGVQVFIPR